MESTKIISLIVSIIFSVLTAFLGRDRKIGYGWSLVLCLFLSPIIGLVFILLSPKRPFVKELRSIEKLYKKGVITHNVYRDKKTNIESQILHLEIKAKNIKESKMLNKKINPTLKELEKSKGLFSEKEILEIKNNIEKQAQKESLGIPTNDKYEKGAILNLNDIHENIILDDSQKVYFEEMIRKHSIRYINNKYLYLDYKYDKLQDCINYAELLYEKNKYK